MDHRKNGIVDSVMKRLESIEKDGSATEALYFYSQFYGSLVSLRQSLFTCNECKLEYRNQPALNGHHCKVKDIYKSGAYHWFKYDESTKKIQSIFFGASKNILENLKFLSLPTRYLIALHSQEKCTDEDFVKKIESAFGENSNGYIYLNFIEMATDHDREKISSIQSLKLVKHAKEICVRDCLDKSLLVFEQLDDDGVKNDIEDEVTYESYEYYMKKTVDHLNEGNFLKFSKDQFNGLTSIIYKDSNLIDNLTEFKKPKTGSENEISKFLTKAQFMANRSLYKNLIKFLEDLKENNKHDMKYMPSLFWRF